MQRYTLKETDRTGVLVLVHSDISRERLALKIEVRTPTEELVAKRLVALANLKDGIPTSLLEGE